MLHSREYADYVRSLSLKLFIVKKALAEHKSYHLQAPQGNVEDGITCKSHWPGIWLTQERSHLIVESGGEPSYRLTMFYFSSGT